MMIILFLLEASASATVSRRFRGRVIAIPDAVFERWEEYPESRVNQAQANIDAAARKLNLQYRAIVRTELLLFERAGAQHTRGHTVFNQGQIRVEINPEIAFDPVILELTLVHENQHYKDLQRLQRPHTRLEEEGLEVKAYEEERRGAQRLSGPFHK